MQLRLAENNTELEALAVTSSYLPLNGIGGTPEELVATLTDPDPEKLYGAEVTFTMGNADGTFPVSVTTEIQLSYDGGTVWNSVSEVEHNIASGTIQRTIIHKMKALAGSTLPGGGVTAGAPSISARCRVKGSNNPGFTASPTSDSKTYFMRLLELRS